MNFVNARSRQNNVTVNASSGFEHLPDNNYTIILVYGKMHTGGVQVLILRYIEFLINNGYRVILVCRNGKLLSEINTKCELYIFERTIELITISSMINSLNKQSKSAYLISFNGPSLINGLLLESLSPFIRSHISGVFHPKALVDSRVSLQSFSYKVALKLLGSESLFFMNHECYLSTRKHWPFLSADCKIIPLPITARTRTHFPRPNSEVINIISVGRYVPFKAYNLAASEVIKECNSLGVRVKWSFYGDGPLKEQMQSMADNSSFSDSIHIFDLLEYSSMLDAIASYDIFVGMGTAALEASSIGVPSIIAIIGDKYKSYGFLKDLPFGNVGEHIVSRQSTPISELICKFSALSSSEKNNLSLACREAASLYSEQSFHDAVYNLSLTREAKRKRIKSFKIIFVACYMFISLLHQRLKALATLFTNY